MHDIVTLEPVSWWPLAPGWYVLILALAITMAWLGYKRLKQWRRNAYRREALKELESIAPQEVPELVKRVCLSTWPRNKVASLSGEAFIKFLNQSDDTSHFSHSTGTLLLELSYNPSPDISRNDPQYQQLIHTTKQWIKHIRTEVP